MSLVAVTALSTACGEPRKGSDPPEAVFESRSLVPVGAVVGFGASLSSDNGLIMSYAFDFGDDSEVVISVSPAAEHVYRTSGTFIVVLTVEDDLGNIGYVAHDLVVIDEETYKPCASDAECATDSECRTALGQCWFRRPGVAVEFDGPT